RNKCFNGSSRTGLLYFNDGLVPDLCATVFELVAIDRGDDRVLYFHQSDGFRYAPRFIYIIFGWTSGCNCAEIAAASADIPEDHKGGCSRSPAFAHVRTIATF